MNKYLLVIIGVMSFLFTSIYVGCCTDSAYTRRKLVETLGKLKVDIREQKLRNWILKYDNGILNQDELLFLLMGEQQCQIGQKQKK